jgi:hypothetical protein
MARFGAPAYLHGMTTERHVERSITTCPHCGGHQFEMTLHETGDEVRDGDPIKCVSCGRSSTVEETLQIRFPDT